MPENASLDDINYGEHTSVWSVTVAASPFDVARALRLIAERIHRDELTLIGLWSTGFGGPGEAVLQVVTTRENPPSPASGES